MWGIVLDHKCEVGLAQQIYLTVKESILSGQIAQGEALPSTRELSKGLNISRNTVCSAYDMLWTEGFIVNRQGALSRVVEGLQIQSVHKAEMAKEEPAEKPNIIYDFKTGQPDLSAFPWKIWKGIVKDTADSLSAHQFAYSSPKGYEPLCVEIAHWLLRARSMKVNPQDVFITSGSTQALSLLVDILNCGCRPFVLENPSHPGIRTMALDRKIPLRCVPVDEQGANTALMDSKDIAAIYVTPSHQFPLGGILPAARRSALIRLAKKMEFYIIEDDYDSEFRYTGSPISPLYAMDSSRVVYVGTFSKTMFPALRLGFAVLPKALHDRWRHARTYMDVQNPIFEQAALAQFLKMRKMDKHIRQMRRIYGDRRDALIEILQSEFGDNAVPWGDASGLHVALQIRGESFGQEFIGSCRNKGLRISQLSRYCFSETEHMDKLLIGYGHLTSEQIREGIKALRQLIQGI